MPMELSAVIVGVVVVGILLALTLFLRENAQRRTSPMPAGLQEEINLPFAAQWTLYHNPFSL